MGTSAESSELILVADDIPANVELLVDQLESLGYRIITAVDGPSAIAACFEYKPDLCILDVSMPAGDLGVEDRATGFEVCRRIKADSTNKTVIVAISGTTEHEKKVLQAGADVFKAADQGRWKRLETVRGYDRRAKAFQDHAGAGFL